MVSDKIFDTNCDTSYATDYDSNCDSNFDINCDNNYNTNYDSNYSANSFLLILHRNSYHMYRHLRFLEGYIQNGKVSIYSMSLVGYDDVPGVNGINLSDEYANLLFINKCLSYTKGVADYLLIAKPTQFLSYLNSTSTNTNSAGKSEEIMNSLISYIRSLKSSDSTTTTSPSQGTKSSDGLRTNSRHLKQSENLLNNDEKETVQNKKPKEKKKKIIRDNTNNSTTISSRRKNGSAKTDTSRRYCMYLVISYGIRDPDTVFGPWGPGEAAWKKDYFDISNRKANSITVLADKYSIVVVDTKLTSALDYSNNQKLIAYCPTIKGRRSRASSNSTIVTVTNYFKLPINRVAGFTYEESYSTTDIIDLNSKSVANSAGNSASVGSNVSSYSDYHNSYASHSNNIKVIEEITMLNLLKNDFHNVTNLNSYKRSIRNDYNMLKKGVPTDIVIRTRENIKSPYWKLLNSGSLKDVLRNIYS